MRNKYLLLVLLLVVIIAGSLYLWLPQTEEQKEATDWQTYRNEEYGFEMGYPEGGEVETIILDSIPIFFFNLGGETEIIDVSPLGKRLRGYEYSGLDFQTSTVPFADGMAIKTIVSLNGKQIQFWLDGFEGVANSNWSLDSEIYVPSIEDGTDKAALIDQMLSTFKFIETQEEYSFPLIPQEQNQGKTFEMGIGNYVFLISVGSCDVDPNNGWCGPVERTMKILNADTKETIQETKLKDSTIYGSNYFDLIEGSPTYYPDLEMNDINFDGEYDLIIHSETSGSYGLSCYDVYLYDNIKGIFVLNKEFTDLLQGDMGVTIDKEKEEIVIFNKSGCCYHEDRTWKVIDNVPQNVYVLSDNTIDRIIREERLENGEWIITEKPFPKAEERQPESKILTGEYCVFDYNNYPDKWEEAESFFDFCEESIPRIEDSLGASANEKVNLAFTEDGFASINGDTISFINTWDLYQPGFLLHEGTHFVQNYGIRDFGRTWVTEGLADLVRFRLTKIQDEPGWAIGCRGDETYTFGYGCAAAFFLWIEDYCNYDNIQIALNEMILGLKGTDSTMENMCGKTTEELWNAYKETAPPERIYPAN